MKFQFRLQRALQFAELKESTKKMEVAIAVQRVEELKTRREAAVDELRNILRESSQNPATIWSTVQATRVAADSDEIKRLELWIRKEEETLRRLRGELGRLALRRKALETLRDKRRHDFEVTRARKEQLDLDEAFRLLGKGKQ